MSEQLDLDAFDRDAFDALMAELDQAMIIVTTASGGERAGCLVGFHCQASIEPAEYAVWLSRANHTYRVGALGEYFGVHFLSKEHRDLAELFGGNSQETTDKFARCDWHPGPDGVPLLDRVADRLVGRRQAWLEAGGDHICLIVAPLLAEHGGTSDWLRLADASHIDPGHDAEERQRAGWDHRFRRDRPS